MPVMLIMGLVEELRSRLDPADEAVRSDLEVISRNGLSPSAPGRPPGTVAVSAARA